MPGITWTQGDSIRSFFGGKEAKFVFTHERKMYLVTYESGEAHVTRIDHEDEGVNGKLGAINSPLFSSDGKKILFAGTTRGKPAFILDAVPGNANAIRLPIDPKARVTADPHWRSDSGKTWIYFATLPGLVNYSDNCQQILGSTYRMEVLADGSLDSIRTTGIPGAYRGGVSKDGMWTGTSYASSAIFDRANKSTIVLAGGEQQCNPSMNPFPVGSKNVDYMMILAFGGKPAYKTIDGKEIIEELHENFWIYNRKNRIVWQAKRPDEDYYLRYDKPEWSTHPEYATAILLQRETGKGDLFVIRIGDLANAEEGELHQAKGYLKIGSDGFTSDSYSHLWVAP
ncbi:MAG: hypothetical protein M3Y08_17495 [Fibrobacterota bacterium]|nr:hypothetical protein [Fibrobacterota bacterium]